MCGLFALFLRRPLTEADVALGRAGTAALRHRGPDGDGEWIDAAKGVFIGHRRLAVIDLSEASAQPMARDGVVLAFNGEIYNYRALREHLAGAGASFTSSGDTEVLLRGWRHWGEGVLERVDGMFAFALWDGARAHLAVDPFGEKPLFWAETGDGVYVSSELAPLVRLLSPRPALSDELLAAYLALGFVPAPETVFPTVRRLRPATAHVVEAGRVGPPRRYWTPPLGEPGRGPVRPLGERDLERLRAALLESLDRRLYADVPVGVFLSGGVDSPLVAAMAKRDLGVALKCVTVAFPRGSVVNEVDEARAVVHHLALDHEVVESDEGPGDAGVDRLLEIYGQPDENVTVFSINQMARAGRAHFTVALTGMGGDEVFYGYGKHAQFFENRRRYRVPEPIRLGLGRLGRRLECLSPRLGSAARLFGVHDWELYLAHKNYPAIDWLRRLPGYAEWARGAFAPPAGRGESRRAEFAVPALELATVMPNSHLTALDLGSMRASLELRTPFLSREVIAAVAEHDPRAFMAFGQKSVLRRLLARYLPAELAQRPKRGFIFPQDRFLETVGAARPRIAGLAPGLVDEAWARRSAGGGWTRLAVRLALAAAFEARHAGPLSRSSAA